MMECCTNPLFQIGVKPLSSYKQNTLIQDSDTLFLPPSLCIIFPGKERLTAILNLSQQELGLFPGILESIGAAEQGLAEFFEIVYSTDLVGK